MFYMKDGETKFGSGPGEGGIKIKGLGVHDHHATFSNSGNDTVHVTPQPDTRILINGQMCTEKTELKHGQRIVFGHGNAFKVMIPNKQGEGEEEPASNYGDIMSDRLNSDTPDAKNILTFLEELKNRTGEAMA